MSQSTHLREYGVETTINFELYEVDGVDFRVNAVDAGGDCSIMTDEEAEVVCDNDFTDEGTGYSLVVSAGEMSGARIIVYIVDSATKVWLDKAIILETYGHALAMHERFPADVEAISGSVPAAGNLQTVYDGVEGFAGAYAGPRGPGVYLNDAAANMNTANGVDGTWANPVSTIAAAKTIAGSLGVDRIYLINNSDVTLAATMEDYEFIGIGEMSKNTITLGSQNVDGSRLWNVLITGIQGGTSRFQADGCILSAITSMEICAVECVIADGSSLILRNDCAFLSCKSAVAGGNTPTLDINSVTNVNVYFRDYSGGIQIDNAVATTIMSYDCPAGQLIIDGTCTDLQIHARGCLSLTDNGTTTDLTSEAAINLTNIIAGCATALTQIPIGDSSPLRQDQGASISGGLATATAMASVTVIQGSEQDLANASASNDTRWTGDDDGAGAEFIFRCTPVDTNTQLGNLFFEGYYDEPVGSTNSATVSVYNFVTASWNSFITLTNASADEIHDISLTHEHRAPGGGTVETVAYTIGDVLIKFEQDVQETGNACLLIDKITAGFISPPVTATEIVDEWETQSQADPTGFHVNMKEVDGIGQTAGDLKTLIDAVNALAATILEDTGTTLPATLATILEDTGTTLPALIAVVQVVVDAIPTTAMRGTDGASTHNAAAVVTALMADTVDTVTLRTLLEAMMAVMFGKATRSGNDTLFKKRDGTTTKVTVTVGATEGERTASVIA